MAEAPWSWSLDPAAEGRLVLRLSGSWRTQDHLPPTAEVETKMGAPSSARSLAFDTREITAWDTGLLVFVLKVIEAGTPRGITADKAGLPDGARIVSLISFLIGLILAFVGAIQLRQFGAQIYIADLVAIGMARERQGRPRRQMTTSTRRRLIAVVLASATLAAGCSGSAQTRFYVLAPAEMAAVAAPALTVGLGPVGLAGYLDRPQIVTRPAADKIDLGEFDQWGEPLRSGISRVLAEDLARQMPSARIAIFPWRGLDQIRYQVVVDVTRLDGPTGGDLALEARWRIVDGAGKEVAVKITRVSEPTGAAGYSAMVSAMSRALAALSREMAQALSALPQ